MVLYIGVVAIVWVLYPLGCCHNNSTTRVYGLSIIRSDDAFPEKVQQVAVNRSPSRYIPSGNSTVSLVNRSQFRCIPSGSSTTAGQSLAVTMQSQRRFGNRSPWRSMPAFPGEGRLYGWAIVHIYGRSIVRHDGAFPCSARDYTAGQWVLVRLIGHTLIKFLRRLAVSN